MVQVCGLLPQITCGMILNGLGAVLAFAATIVDGVQAGYISVSHINVAFMMPLKTWAIFLAYSL